MKIQTPVAEYKEHHEFVREVGRSEGCIICSDNTSIVLAHIKYSDAAVGRIHPGTGNKNHKWVIPLCCRCHDLQHAYGNERNFWREQNLNPNPPSAYLWLNTGDHEAGCKIVREAREGPTDFFGRLR